MNKPAKVAGTQTVEQVLDEMDKQRETNLKIWNALAKTDPAQTKPFNRAGGFKGTAVKPIWVVKRLTELFGPCGEGWGIGSPKFEIVHGDHKEVLVYCTVECWHGSPENKLFGVGGDKVVTHIKANPQYNRAERWENDDEAFKKAFTDAVNNAFKFVGVAADIHMGQFDDSKYVNELRKEFADPPANDGNGNNPTTGEPKPRQRVKLDGPYTCPTQLMTAAREFVRTLEGIGDGDELHAFLETPDAKAFCVQLERDMPAWWETGENMPAEFMPLKFRIEARKRELSELETIRR